MATKNQEGTTTLHLALAWGFVGIPLTLGVLQTLIVLPDCTTIQTLADGKPCLAALAPTDAGLDFRLTLVWGAFMSKKFHRRLVSLTLLDIAAGIAVSAVLCRPWRPTCRPKCRRKHRHCCAGIQLTGFYVGAHAGYRWADADLTTDPYTFTPPLASLVSVPGRNENYGLNGGIVGSASRLQLSVRAQLAARG